MAGNVLVGGLIGAAIDAGSGAMKDLQPNPVKINLVPLSARRPDDAIVPNRKRTTEERIKELKRMLDERLISEEEYQQKRKDILDEL